MSKKPFSEDIQIKYELVNVNKIIHVKEQKGGLSQMHSVPQIGKEAASLLIAICPKYSFDLLKLELTQEAPPISGKYLASLKPLSVGNHIAFFVGIYELLTPLTFLRGISETNPEKIMPFEQIKSEVAVKALELEARFMDQETQNISSIFAHRQDLENKSNAPPQVLLTSQVRADPDFKQMCEKIRKFYYNMDVIPEKTVDQKQYSKAVNACAGSAIQRIFKDFHALLKFKKFYCAVKNEQSGEAYSLQDFMLKLMTEHLLDEMVLTMFAGQAHNMDYFVHYVPSKGKSRETVEMEHLLTLTKQFLLPENYANKLLWQPIRFVERLRKVEEEKFTKPSTLPVVPEVTSNLSPIPVTRSRSSSSSDGSSSSDDDKSPLSSSPPKTFYTQSDTVTLAKDVYDLLFDQVSSSDSVEVRKDLIDTMKKNNLKKNNLSSPKEKITLKVSGYRFLHRLATSNADVEDRINLLDTYRRRESLPDPGTPDLLLTNNAVEAKKTQTPIATPLPIPLNNNLPVSTNRNGIFKNPQPQPKESETKQSQSLSPSPPQKRHNSLSSSPAEKGYGLYNSYSYSPGNHKWKRKDGQSELRRRTISSLGGQK